MLVVIDVGNTNITLGVYDQDELIANFRLTTKLQRTSDEFGITLFSFFQTKNIDPKGVEDVLISSVVPKIMHSLTNAIRKYFNIEPIIVGPGIKTGISVKTENPREVGADRIVDIAAAYHIYGGPALVIDFGTATSFDIVNSKKEFLGGVIAPGINTQVKCLKNATSKLPKIDISISPSAIGKNTTDAILSGVIRGSACMVDGLVAQCEKELGNKATIIATGGYCGLIANYMTRPFDVVNPILTLEGLKRIYELNTVENKISQMNCINLQK